MKVAHVTYSSNGGAGSIAKALGEAQRAIGIDATLLSVSSSSISERPLSNPGLATAAVIEKYLISAKGAGLITPLRGNAGFFDSLASSDFDVIHLHWLPGAVAERLIGSLLQAGKKVVWTLHDYRPITGGCHYAQGCNLYQSSCNSCPQVRPAFACVIERNLSQKVDILGSSQMVLAAPSQGLVSAAKTSSLGRNLRVEYLPNPLSLDSNGELLTKKLEDFSAIKLLFVAADVRDPRKGLHKVLEWFLSTSSNFQLKVIGRHSEQFSNGDRVTGLGLLGPAELKIEFMNANALLFASREDNAPGVVAEAVAAGLPIVNFEREMTSWLALDGLETMSPDQLSKESLNLSTAQKEAYVDFLHARTPSRVAQNYIALYQSL